MAVGIPTIGLFHLGVFVYGQVEDPHNYVHLENQPLLSAAAPIIGGNIAAEEQQLPPAAKPKDIAYHNDPTTAPRITEAQVLLQFQATKLPSPQEIEDKRVGRGW